ncbi:MAG: hypothetical protein IT460_07040 [Planctomycetes bacterium]|nr:hypothetical protein [Planctomycetota bacterium]
MDRRSWLVGFLAGGWVATLLAFSGASPFRAANAQDATPPPAPNPPAMGDGFEPTSPGPTINPSTGSVTRGQPSSTTNTGGFNNRAIALTAPVGNGEHAVYYFDTELQRLLVYQFRAGDRGGVRLMAARHIDYDLKLESYRDLSERSRDELKADYDAMTRGKPAAGPVVPELPVKKVDSPFGK